MPGALGASEELDKVDVSDSLHRRGKGGASAFIVSAGRDGAGEPIADHGGLKFVGDLDHRRQLVRAKAAVAPDGKDDGIALTDTVSQLFNDRRPLEEERSEINRAWLRKRLPYMFRFQTF
jgi:hypothetical protein